MFIFFKSSAISFGNTFNYSKFSMYFLNEIENHAKSGRGCSKCMNTIAVWRKMNEKTHNSQVIRRKDVCINNNKKHLKWTYCRILQFSFHCRITSWRRSMDNSNTIWQYLYSSVILTNWVILLKWGQDLC